MRVASLEDDYLYNFDNWGYSQADASPAASLVAVLIIIKALIFLSAFIYQLVNQLRPPQHSNTSALLHYLSSHFYTSLLHFFPPVALINPLFPLLQQLFSNDLESYALKFRDIVAVKLRRGGIWVVRWGCRCFFSMAGADGVARSDCG